MSMSNTEKTVKDIRRNTRRKFSTEEKIRIVLDGLRGESSVAELCRREGINPNLYYRWSKDFLEAGKKRLSGDTVREANTDEVTGLKRENGDLAYSARSASSGSNFAAALAGTTPAIRPIATDTSSAAIT